MTKKIIVVDDSWTVRQMIKLALTEGDFEIVEAQDGVDGLEKLAQNRDTALMICDVNMPRMDGLSLIETLRRDPANQGLHLVMLTAEGHVDQLARAKKAGAKAWIVKPFKPELLLAVVKKLIERSP